MKLILAALLLSASMAWAQSRPEIIFENQIEIPAQENLVLGDFVQLKNPSPLLTESVEKLAITPEQLERGLNAQNIREIYKKLILQNPEVTAENPKLVVPQKIEIKKALGFSVAHFRNLATAPINSPSWSSAWTSVWPPLVHGLLRIYRDGPNKIGWQRFARLVGFAWVIPEPRRVRSPIGTARPGRRTWTCDKAGSLRINASGIDRGPGVACKTGRCAHKRKFDHRIAQ